MTSRCGAVLAALAITTAACGSTVAHRAQQTSGLTGTGENSSGLNATGATADTATPGSASAGGSTAAASGRTASAARNTAAANASSTSASGITIVGPGADAKTINVGVPYTVNSGAANAAIGAGGISQADGRQDGQILADDINAHGGIAGRKLNLIFHQFDSTSTQTADAQEQQECDDYTKDHKVFAVFEGSGVRDLTRSCVESGGSLLIDNPLTTSDQSVFDRYKHYVEIGAFRLDRMAAIWPDQLAAQGWLKGRDANTGADSPLKAKIGIVTYDYPTFANTVDHVLLPKLARMGYKVDQNDIRKVTWLQSNSDAAALAAGLSAAVLRFRQDSVTHVLIMDERGLLTLLFAQQAQSQQYFPRYGWNSQNGPQAFKDAANFPSQQMAGTVGMGWSTGLDIPVAQDTPDGPYSNDRRRQCNALYKSHGVTFSDHNAEAGALDDCTTFWFFRDVMNSITGSVTRDSFMARVDQLGSSFQGAGGFGLFFGPKQHDGISVVRHFAYDAKCDCMQYTSGNIDIG